MVTQARTTRRRSPAVTPNTRGTLDVQEAPNSNTAAESPVGRRASPTFAPLPACVRQVEETCPAVRPGSFSLRITKQGKLQVLCFEAPLSRRHG